MSDEWKNFATSSLALMMANAERQHNHARSLAVMAMHDALGADQVKSGAWTTAQAEQFLLADALKEWVELEIDDVLSLTPIQPKADFICALCRAGFEDVDWHELADHYLAIVRE